MSTFDFQIYGESLRGLRFVRFLKSISPADFTIITHIAECGKTKESEVPDGYPLPTSGCGRLFIRSGYMGKCRLFAVAVTGITTLACEKGRSALFSLLLGVSHFLTSVEHSHTSSLSGES